MKNEIKINVSTNLTITDQTVQRCLTLIAMHAQDNDIAGMVIRFEGSDYSVVPLKTPEEVEAALYSKFKNESQDTNK